MWRQRFFIIMIFALAVVYISIDKFPYSWLFKPCTHSLRSAHQVNRVEINTIAFGSCASTNDDLSIFGDISADLVVFLGDNVYADTDKQFYMHWMYNRLTCISDFQGMVSRAKHVVAIWDDHDFGSDNIGKENPIKYESQSIFLDFWRIPLDSERRRGEGVYGSYKFDMPKVVGGGTFSIIMPDLRFFRDPLKFCENSTDSFCPNSSGMMLGVVQWNWLEEAIRTSQREDRLTIIASSTQFGHSPNGYESWNNFPVDRARLKSLLDPSKSLIISGDVHWGEVSILDKLVDVTSSGFSCVDPNILDNLNRVGTAYAQQNYGLIDLREKTVSLYGHGNKLLFVQKLP